MEPASEDTGVFNRSGLDAGEQLTKTDQFQFDEIGYWSELKLEIIEKYGSAYTTAFAKQKGLKKFYIDAFSGGGIHLSKQTRAQIDGSPARALKVSPPFDHFYFIDLNPQKTAYLETLCKGRSDVDVVTQDASSYLTKTLLPTIKYEKYNRALCLLDPYGLHLDWEVIREAGASRAIDMFLNFPVMDMNRNAIWRNPDKAKSGGIERMTRFWGDESWKSVAYAESPQGDLFSSPQIIKQSNDAIVSAFQERLKTVASFSVVPTPLPMKNKRNAVVYYLFFASQKAVAKKIVDGIFAKYM
jgi:three-Cys-motif partner protein